ARPKPVAQMAKARRCRRRRIRRPLPRRFPSGPKTCMHGRSSAGRPRWYTIEDRMTAALVLSAGFGTRLRPLTDELPKPLMPVGDRPMLAHVVEALARGGVSDVVVNTHHRAEDFASPIARFGLGLQVIHEPEILGTAGGLANAAGALGA